MLSVFEDDYGREPHPADELILIEEYLPILKAQHSFYEFARQSWAQTMGPDKPFVDGWHIGAICEHLEAVTKGQIRNLIINIPPRCMKSTLVSVMWPAWVWISQPYTQFLYASYAAALSNRDSRYCRGLISSPWYKRRWGHIFSLVGDQNTKIRFDNDRGGYRISTSVGGSSTGEGGHFLVLDDPNNAKDGESEALRVRANDFYSGVWSTRLNNRKTGCRVIMQQRIDTLDVTGHVLANDLDGEWTKLILPMEFETARRSKTIILPSTQGKIWQDPRVKEGELLWPGMIGEKELKSLKSELGNAYRISGQLQQSPAPADGGIIKKSHFKWWKNTTTPKILQTIQSWDTALEEKERDCYSACTTWGIFEDENQINNIILLGCWYGRLEYPELRAMAKRLYKDYRDDGTVDIKPDGGHMPDIVLIESKASGSPLIQDLRRAGIMVVGFNPTRYGDKVKRASTITHFIEGGRVCVPAQPPSYAYLRPFARNFVDLCGIFPAKESRDVVDTMSQVFHKLAKTSLLTHPKDDVIIENPQPRKPLYGSERERENT
jgi:predicted phage terminase large subunit-like protein